MGGDLGPRLSVPASLAFLQQYSDCRVTLVGDSALIHSELHGHSCTRLSVLHAPDVVAANDKASHALRHGQNSSLWKCLELVAEQQSDACVSAGNTGALMAVGKHLLGTFSGVQRPAICKPIPSEHGCSYLLDLGANLECSAEHLVQFALMGVALARTAGLQRPRVALLNVGSEDTKGVAEVQAAAAQLRASPSVDFVGFVEGDGLYLGLADVIVCNGFVGNVALKASEGVARLLFASLERHMQTSMSGRISRWLGRASIRGWAAEFSPSRYNGAALLGLRQPVIKSHGGADVEGFVQALSAAREQVRMSLVAQLCELMQLPTKP